MRVDPYGERAVLITPDSPGDVPAVRSYAAALPGILDAVAGAETVLAVFAATVPAIDWSGVALAAVTRSERTVEVPVVYDGADLPAVAAQTGLSIGEVVAVHTEPEYTVRFCGFSPGFGYLDGLDQRLRLPRHRSPRTSVPAGSVALAGAFTGVYPRSSPGGWQLLGRTEAVLWDARRDPPALLAPGTRVRFVAVIEIVRTGALLTVQDAGRTGWASLGVPRSGAFDRGAARVANRLVGNPDDAALLEATLGGVAVRALDAATIALTGALCPGADFGAAVSLRAGAVLTLGTPVAGLRSYLAVRGGVAVAAELGSRSTDVLSGLGPAPLRVGDRVPIGPAPAVPPSGATAVVRSANRPLHARLAPRADWFTAAAGRLLAEATWTVRPDSDRIGLRLNGPALPRSRDGELPSEPTLPGALQVPPDGRPIVLGPDAPVTGGYPVIAVVQDADLDLAAQLRPGDSVRFSVS